MPWHDLEAVGAFHSKGQTVDANIAQVVAYAGYLLAVRPDRVSVFGLYLGPAGFAVVFMTPSQPFRTNLIDWAPDNTISPLLASVLDLIQTPHASMVDPTTEWKDNGTFTITIGTKAYPGCRLACSPGLERWTSVFRTGQSVIKSQYRKLDSKPEAEILKYIHQGPRFPGVVRVVDSVWVRRPDLAFVESGMTEVRRKVVMALMDEGMPFMEIKTPFDALATIWDLLEGETSLPTGPMLIWSTSDTPTLRRASGPPSGYQYRKCFGQEWQRRTRCVSFLFHSPPHGPEVGMILLCSISPKLIPEQPIALYHNVAC